MKKSKYSENEILALKERLRKVINLVSGSDRGANFLLAALAFSCSNPSGPESNGANVTIEYYVGSMNFSDAGIFVNGSFLQYVDKNSTAEISVTVGDELQAKYANYEIYPYTGVQQTRSTTAKDGMTWRIP